MIDDLDRLIADLEGKRQQLLDGIEHLQRARAVLDPESVADDEPPTTVALPVEVVQVATAKAMRPKTASKKPRGGDPVDCPDCGRRCGSAAGLAMHRKSHRGQVPAATPPAPPVAAVSPAPAPKIGDTRPAPFAPVRPIGGTQAPVVAGKVLRCGQLDCGQELPNITELSRHTIGHHGRQPTNAERILVTPDAARESA